MVYNSLGSRIEDTRNIVSNVNLFDYLKDLDYFIKNVETLENQRSDEIAKIEKGEVLQEMQEEAGLPEAPKLSNY